MSDFTYSTHQEDVFNWISTGRGHAFVSAVAGSGKTFTIVHAAKRIVGSGLFVAFNKDIATELSNRLEGTTMQCGTIHSKGLAVLKSGIKCRMGRPDTRKYGPAFSNRLGLRGIKKAGDMSKLVDLIRSSLEHEIHNGRVTVTAKNVEKVIDHHGILIDETITTSQLAEDLTIVLNDGLAQVEAGRIDFTDMIWAPVVLGLKAKTYSWVFVDEAQDLCRCKFALVQKFVGKGGRMLFVGDPRQAIYGFAGADAESVKHIQEHLNCTILPLSVTYRCPKSHVAFAKSIDPSLEIQAADDAVEGNVETVRIDEVPSMIQEGDMILCRVNAPLVRMCFALIAQGLPARVRGRSIEAELIKIITETEKRNKSFSTFPDTLNEQEKEIVEKLQGYNARQITIDAVCDKFKCIKIIHMNSGADSFPSLKNAVKEIFSDERGSITLSSVHKAKGLEAERVYILCPNKMPHPMASQPWEREQEMNIQYVAYTRSKRDLFIIDGEPEELDL